MIGDLGVPGAQTVVSTTTKNGGCVVYTLIVTISRLRDSLSVFNPRNVVATKCNVVGWDDQLFVCMMTIIDPKRRVCRTRTQYMCGRSQSRGWKACRAQADDLGGQPDRCFLQ